MDTLISLPPAGMAVVPAGTLRQPWGTLQLTALSSFGMIIEDASGGPHPLCRDDAVYLSLSRYPGGIERELASAERRVVIDEVQRLPHLLNEVPPRIETRHVRFLLTDSSARKLRSGGTSSQRSGAGNFVDRC